MSFETLRYLAAEIGRNEINIPKQDFTGNESIRGILQIVFALAGVMAIIILILAGLKYNTALGDPQKTNEAKNAIIYAAIGLAVAVGAFSLVSLIVGGI